MDKMRVLKHYAFQEVTADLLNSIATSLFQMSDGMAQAFIAGFENTDHLIFQDLDVTPDGVNLAIRCGLKGVLLYRTDAENCIVGVYKGTRPDKNTPYSEEIIALDPASITDPRIDLLEAEIVEEDDSDYFETVQMFNQVTETSFALNQYIRRVRNVKLYIKTGVAAPSPVAPLATAGRMAIKEIHVAQNATSLLITDIKSQPFDYLTSEWTAANPTKKFPSIYEVIEYVNYELSLARRQIFSGAGVYSYQVPRYRTKVYLRIASGGGGGESAAILANNRAAGSDGQDTQVSGLNGGLLTVFGGKGGRNGIPGRANGIYSNKADSTLLVSNSSGGYPTDERGGYGAGINGTQAVARNKFKLGSVIKVAGQDNGLVYFAANLTGFGISVATIDLQKRTNIFLHGSITQPVFLGYDSLYASPDGEFLIVRGFTSYWKLDRKGNITHYIGDPNNTTNGNVDGPVGVNRVQTTNSTSYLATDDQNAGGVILNERDIFTNSPNVTTRIRRVSPSGDIVTEVVLPLNNLFLEFIADPTTPNSVVGHFAIGGTACIAKIDRSTGVVTYVTGFNAQGFLDGALNTAQISSVRAIAYVQSQDRLIFLDSQASRARLRYISNYSTLIGSVVGTLYETPALETWVAYGGYFNEASNKFIMFFGEDPAPIDANFFVDVLQYNFNTNSVSTLKESDRNETVNQIDQGGSGINGGGGAGGNALNGSEFGGAGGGALMLEGQFDVSPGTLLQITVGSGGLGGVSPDGPLYNGHAGGDGFVEVSW